MTRIYCLILLLIPFVVGSQNIDLILHNGKIFTAEPDKTSATAIAVKGKRIYRIGDESILDLRGPNTIVIDLKGKFCMPGLIEGHGHMNGLGASLNSIDLLDAQSWDEAIHAVKLKVAESNKGRWIEGRGWHQEKFKKLPLDAVGGYPSQASISAVSPDNPVILVHASGHALFANAKAMSLAGIDRNTPDPAGGKIIRDKNGNPTGIFEENAMELFAALRSSIEQNLNPDEQYQSWERNMQAAQELCLKNGITSFHDAGVSVKDFANYVRYAEQGQMTVRMYLMLLDSIKNIESIEDRLPMKGHYNGFLTVRAIKQFIDGALGSHGAWLLKPYTDKPALTGQNVLDLQSLSDFAEYALNHHLQLCVHAIGDRGNREVLNIYESAIMSQRDHDNLRWRIEHAQHVSPEDLGRFGKLGIIASMQAVHCTSDAPYVTKRLGEERARTESYMWRSLIDSGAHLANGTDTPVEKENPFDCIYSAVTRKRKDTGIEFYPEQKMTREEALLSYTLWNAYAAFEEDLKGSIKVGKLADLIVTDKDLLKCPESKIPDTKVVMTILNGKIVYQQ